MKILELRLTAFGPFTDRVLDLVSGNHGLHVIFGPNEAGKSSALRALHALLYGIPAQTDDAFLHPYDKLRIGARLRLSSGEEIDFSRRKAIKGSLLGPDGTRLEDRALDRFLGGVDPDQFRMFWGIDHARLVAGGREILDGRGDLGASLFAAGTGASHLGALRKKLEEEATALFVSRGHSRPINQAVIHIRELRSAQREATVSADEWTRQDRAAHDADGRIAHLTERAQELAREKSRLERLKRVLPLLAERQEVRRHLADLGDVVLLAEDFPKRRQDAETALHLAQHHLERVEDDLRKQEEVFAELGATTALVAEADAVNKLYSSLGSQRKASSDRPGLVGQRDEHRILANRLLRELRPDLKVDAAETLRLFVGRRARIQKLAAERERLDERLDAGRRRHKEAQELATTLTRETSALPPARDPETLVAAIEEARSRGDAEAEREKANGAHLRIVAECDAAIEKLRLGALAINKLKELRIPTDAAIARFERRSQDFDDEARVAKADSQRVAKTTRELDSKIETLKRMNAVPTEADLIAARVRRDDAFGLLRDQWVQRRDVAAEMYKLLGSGDLIDLYANAVKAADEVADRLRSEAGRVAELAQYLEEREHLNKETEEGNAASRRRENDVAELDTAWREAWRPVLTTPPPILDARAWREDFERLIERAEAALDASQGRAELNEWIEMQLKALRLAMTALEPTVPTAGSLSAIVRAAEKMRQRLESDDRIWSEHARRTRDTEQEIRNTEAAVRAAQADFEAWQRKWDEAARGLIQGDVPPPDDALVALDGVDKILRAIDDVANFDARISGIDRDAESFRADIRVLSERFGESGAIEGGSEDAWVEALHKRLTVAIQEEERRRQICANLERLRADVAQDERAADTAHLTLATLREEAKCGADGDLVIAERRSADLRRYQSDSERIEKELVRSGDGASISQLESVAVGADMDAIDVRIAQIATELPEVETDLSGVRDTRAAAQAELRRLQGPSAAGEKAEEFQATLARLRDDVVRFARLRVASTLLARRIDDYRRKNQAPLLLRAGALLREMTLQSIERLEADIEEDRPILVGLRPDGTHVPSHGMSEGTRDQLFFALRLAAVEASCSVGEPMPFVVDDVLVQFDDDRSTAALRVLADVASHTQVVLFTHHQHVRTFAKALSAPAGVIVHEL